MGQRVSPLLRDQTVSKSLVVGNYPLGFCRRDRNRDLRKTSFHTTTPPPSDVATLLLYTVFAVQKGGLCLFQLPFLCYPVLFILFFFSFFSRSGGGVECGPLSEGAGASLMK